MRTRSPGSLWGEKSTPEQSAPRRGAPLVLCDRFLLAQEEGQLVEAVEQAVAGERFDREGRVRPVGEGDRAGLEVDGHGGWCAAARRRDHLLVKPRLDGYRQQTVLQAVVPEDRGERRADHGAEAEIVERPRSVLARRAAAEVVPRHQNLRRGGLRPVEHEVRARRAVLRVAPVGEQMPAQPRLPGDLQEARRNDDVRVDVVDRQDDVARRDGADWLHAHSGIISRASAIRPATALAAAVSGLARKVRPPAPCRPSKLRLLVLTAYCPGRSWSPFMAMHIEQPASRHSPPASRNTRSSPSASASFFTCCEPGTTSSRTLAATFRPRSSDAARRKSLSRAFVHEPMNTTSIGCPRRRCPGLSPM